MPSSDVHCPQCQTLPTYIDGFLAFAPALTSAQEGYRTEFYGEYAHLEERHFWFSVRCQLIVWALQKYCSSLASFFEVGCGTGYVLQSIGRAFPQAKLYGSEMLTTGLRFAASRLPSATFIQMDARQIPYVNEFDAIGAFDVLEHIEEDDVALKQAHGALKNEGILVLTVPQHAWLWSSIDQYSCHVRRYSAKELHSKVEAAGFEILRSTSFVSLLLPAMLLSRASKQDSTIAIDPMAELKIPSIVNRTLRMLMSLEAWLIRCGISFPLGGSRLVVARKKS
jgi:SAM-dependent methyltransferase